MGHEPKSGPAFSSWSRRWQLKRGRHSRVSGVLSCTICLVPLPCLHACSCPLWPHHSLAQDKAYQQPLAGLGHLDIKASLTQTSCPTSWTSPMSPPRFLGLARGGSLPLAHLCLRLPDVTEFLTSALHRSGNTVFHLTPLTTQTRPLAAPLEFHVGRKHQLSCTRSSSV